MRLFAVQHGDVESQRSSASSRLLVFRTWFRHYCQMPQSKLPLIYRIYDVVLPPFRRRRMARLDAEVLQDGRIESVLDLGGTASIWQYTDHSPDVTIVNIQPQEPSADARFTHLTGDATDLPFEDSAFDLAFSNSVIEHVGEDRWEAFASECRRLAPAVFVQTPARSFPFEPHFLTPFIHYFPKSVQRRLARRATVWGLLQRPTQDQAASYVDNTTLLSKQDMERLFPDCEILTERFLGVAKSYIAVRVP